MAENQKENNNNGVKFNPRFDPDPTVLTTAALMREIEHLNKTFDQIFRARDEIRNDKFSYVEKQFALIERHREEQKLDTKAAVDAALIAQKEAVKEQTLASERAIAKSESATTKQLDQQASGFSTAISGVFNQLNDVKERMTRVESGKQGGTDRAQAINTVIIAVLALITMGSIIMGIVQHLGK